MPQEQDFGYALHQLDSALEFFNRVAGKTMTLDERVESLRRLDELHSIIWGASLVERAA